MILYQLKCGRDHRFEGWFRNGAAFDAQAAAQSITCPLCGDSAVAKAPMAPSIVKGGSKAPAKPDEAPREPSAPSPAPADPDTAKQAEMLRALRALRQHVEATSDYVGERFAEEALKMHYGEAESRAIYGETSEQEAERLKEEGVPVARIPWVPTGN